jgi:cytochrome P450
MGELVRLDRRFVQDPHELYRRLRAEAPAHPVLMWGRVRIWLVTRYADAKALLADPRLSKDHAGALALFPPGTEGALASPLSATMLMTDPPDHTRLRRLVTKAFTARAVAHLRPRIERIADELLDAIAAAAAHGEVDLIGSYALPLPLRVIGELLGVPAADRAAFRVGVERILTTTDQDALHTTMAMLADLLTRLIAGKRAAPAEDLLSALVQVSEDGDQLSERELLATTYLLILAGYETTVNLIGNGILALLRNPVQLRALRAAPARLPEAVEEFLRFESPLNLATTRFSTEAIRLGEVTIPAGELVVIGLLAANHDGARFDYPDQLDIGRTANPHLAFGHGIHYCVGAPLARMEGAIALGRLLARFDDIRLADGEPPHYRNSTLMRGLSALRVRLEPTVRRRLNRTG